MKKLKRAASLSIKSPGKMSKRGRRDIANWMRKQAAHLTKHGKDYTEGRFTASFNYN